MLQTKHSFPSGYMYLPNSGQYQISPAISLSSTYSRK